MDDSKPASPIYHFDRFVLDLRRGVLLALDGTETPLRPKSFALLRMFVENAGQLLDRDTIMRNVWPEVFVSDDSITQCVRDIRRALGDKAQRLLRTIPRRGYLFAAKVLPVEQSVTGSEVRQQQIASLSEALIQSTGPYESEQLEIHPNKLGEECQDCRPLSGMPPQNKLTNPAPLPKAERRQLTVLICDLVGSTELCDQMDTEDFSGLIRAFLERCAAVIKSCRGHVSGYMGDGVLAYFGYPCASEDAAEQSVRAGLAIIDEINKFKPDPGLTPRVRVSIASGLVVNDRIGDVGAEQISVGIPLNLAARLQKIAEPGTVIIADTTRRLIGEMFALEDLGCYSLRGFSTPARAWRVTGPGTAESRFEALHGANLMPLIGREQELSLLLDRWELAREGEGQVVLLAGEPGIGKSRLVQALRDKVNEEAHADLSYYCSPNQQDSTLRPVISYVERMANLTHRDNSEQTLTKLASFFTQGSKDIVRTVPLLISLLSIPIAGHCPLSDMSPQVQRDRTLAALADHLAGLTTERPVLLVWEDMHWADPTSLELLELMIHRLRNLPVLAIVTFRPEFTPPWPNHTHITWLWLSRLSRTRSIQVVAGLTGGKLLPGVVLDQIMDRAEGIPLFLEELTKTVLDLSLLQDVGNVYKLKEPLLPIAIPATLEDSLMARLDRLGSIKEIAQIAAVIGREFSRPLLAAAAAMTDVELGVALDSLIRAEIIFFQSNLPQVTYSFKHALVRDAAYATLIRRKKRDLHGRIAEVLYAALPDVAEAHPELLAHHYTEAGRLEAAVPAWLLAGQRALARSALVEAVAQLRKGLTLLSSMPDGAWRRQQELDLQITLGRALIATQGHAAPETGAAYVRARELCEQLGRPPQIVPVLFGQCVHHLMRAELALSRAHASEMQRLGEERGDVRLRLMGYRLAGQPELGLGEFAAARDHLEQGLALFDPSDRPFYSALALQDARVMMLNFLSQTLLCTGYPDQAHKRWEEALAEARELKHPYTVAITLGLVCTLSIAVATTGPSRASSAVCTVVEELATLSDKHNFPMLQAMGTLYQGWCLTTEGRVKDGLALLDHGMAAYRNAGTLLWEPFFLTVLANAHDRAGQPENGLKPVTEAARLIETTQENWIKAEVDRLRGELLARMGQYEEAEACFRRALATAQRQEAKLWELRSATSLAQLWCALEMKDKARDLLAPIYNWFTEGFDTPDLKNAVSLLAELGYTRATLG